ncbi:MAG: DNA gyrase/topoisomerase IV subunit A, partial [Longimicrobiaceae bacterium]
LAALAMELLADIDRETVDFAPNFDDRLEEPTVLPSKVPNLLINGSSGIAVGMSTNIPPHNLRETVAAALHLLDHPDCTVADLMEHLPGPDFPTGGVVVGVKGIRDAYETGRGRVVMRARIAREERRGGREQLVVREIPYGTNKTRLMAQIVALAKSNRIPDLADLRDESDREGIRVVIALKRGADPDKVVAKLFRWTALQATFGVISLALDGGVPRTFDLKELLERFRDHRIEVVVRRSRWQLERARTEAHLLEGLLVALGDIDEVVRLIRGSRDRGTAGRKLRQRYKLSEEQANAILAMRLARLTALETREVRERLEALRIEIGELEALIASPERQLNVVREELRRIGGEYGDARRTRIVASEKEWRLERADAYEDVMVAITAEGHAKRIPMALHLRRSGRGVGVLHRDDGDAPERLFAASTRQTLLFFTSGGRVHALGVGEIPEAGPSSRGRALTSLLGVDAREQAVAMIPLPEQTAGFTLLFATAKGTVKRTELDEHARTRAGGADAIGIRRGDRLLEVLVADLSGDVLLLSRQGRAIRFPVTDVPVTGRGAQGVRGIRLRGDDRVAAAVRVRRGAQVALVTERGWGLRIAPVEVAVQGRGGLGSALLDGDAAGAVMAALEVTEGEELRLTTSGGEVVRVAVADLPAPAEKVVAPIAEIGAERVVGCSRALAAGRTEIPEEPAPAHIAAGEAGELDLFAG